METSDKKNIVQRMWQATVNNQTLGGVGSAGQSPILANLFNPNWDLAQFFNAFFKTAIIVGAMLAVLRLGYAGFIYMTTDSFGALGDAKEIIKNAVIGLLLLLSIWLILNQINPNLLNLNILQQVQRVDVPSSPPPAGPTAAPPPAASNPPPPPTTGGTQYCYTRNNGALACYSSNFACAAAANFPPSLSGPVSCREYPITLPGCDPVLGCI